MSARGPVRRRSWTTSLYVVVACAMSLLAAGGAQADEPGHAAGAAAPPPTGADIFRVVCAGCHMPDARGARGGGFYPALAADPALASKSYAARVLVFGRRNMPAFGAKHAVGMFFDPVTLTDDQIASVINYVRSHFGNHYKDTLTAAEVAAIDGPEPH